MSMNHRISRDESLMAQALITSLRSTCSRKQVGAILALQGRIISSGYAGAPSGLPHCLDVGCEVNAINPHLGCQRTVHAELNAIAYAARHGISTNGASLYCTLSPCVNCAKALINAGITHVFFHEAYRDQSGIKLLLESGVQCTQLNALSVNVTHEPTQSASHSKPSEQGELFSS